MKPEKKDTDLIEFGRIRKVLLPIGEGTSKRALGYYIFNLDDSELNIC